MSFPGWRALDSRIHSPLLLFAEGTLALLLPLVFDKGPRDGRLLRRDRCRRAQARNERLPSSDNLQRRPVTMAPRAPGRTQQPGWLEALEKLEATLLRIQAAGTDAQV